MAGKLAGKVGIVTGASKGIGAAIAQHLAAEGAAVVVNYSSSKEGADRVVAEITGKGGKAMAVQANVAKAADIQRLFAETKKAYGGLDILVNNAGIYEFAPHRGGDGRALPQAVRSQCPRPAARGPGGGQSVRTRTGGSIINISSVVSTSAPPAASVYSATKAAVDAVTRSLAKELGPRKIRVNSINPGMVETEGVRAAGIAESDMRKQIEAQTPLGRIGQPRDIAPAAVFLASDDSAWITGETFYIAGGYR